MSYPDGPVPRNGSMGFAKSSLLVASDLKDSMWLHSDYKCMHMRNFGHSSEILRLLSRIPQPSQVRAKEEDGYVW